MAAVIIARANQAMPTLEDSIDTKAYFGFKFAKVAVADLTTTTTDIKYNGEVTKDWDLVLEFIYPDGEFADQSTYLVFVDDQLKYVGQYSGIFADRWLLKRNGVFYIDHSKNDYEIQKLLKSPDPPEISIWLSLAPFLTAPDGERWNINKALEQRMILEFQPEWNRTGKSKPTAGKLVQEIVGI